MSKLLSPWMKSFKNESLELLIGVQLFALQVYVTVTSVVVVLKVRVDRAHYHTPRLGCTAELGTKTTWLMGRTEGWTAMAGRLNGPRIL